jgi:hypothetical protein
MPTPALLEAIGRMPVIPLPGSPDHASLWLRLDGASPSGSTQDRMAPLERLSPRDRETAGDHIQCPLLAERQPQTP